MLQTNLEENGLLKFFGSMGQYLRLQLYTLTSKMQDGVAERSNRTILEKVRSIIMENTDLKPL